MTNAVVVRQIVRRTRGGHLELWRHSLRTSMWNGKLTISVESRLTGVAIIYSRLLSIQLPFDDEHVPSLFRKIKCELPLLEVIDGSDYIDRDAAAMFTMH